MGLKTNFHKFINHLKSGGLFYAIWRGTRYFTYVLTKPRTLYKFVPQKTIAKGKTKIAFSEGKLHLFWDGVRLTAGAGLNVAVNTLGLLTDSLKADWRILNRDEDCFEFRVIFKELPLTLNWLLKIESEQRIAWKIDAEIEGSLYIDEFRIVTLFNPVYKTYLNNYWQADLPRMDLRWHDLCLINNGSNLVGLRFPLSSGVPEAVTLETEMQTFYPLIQSTASDINARIVGFRYLSPEGKECYAPGNLSLFSGEINLFKDENLLDYRIEDLRQRSLKRASQERMGHKTKPKLKILLANLPWQKDGKWGVRAGSRWPHIKDESEGEYLSFPFFMAYATSLLLKNNLDTVMIDAIAEQIPEAEFMESILSLGMDYLVTETSVPSFGDDLKMLEKISRAGIRIILCGPNSEIYKPEFLETNQCIDLVIFGEYEFTLLELIQRLQKGEVLNGVKGLIYRDGGKIIKNPAREPFDINLLPWPYRNGLPMKKYLDAPGNMPLPCVQMAASRGCPFKCSFCLWPQVIYQGHHYRVRRVEDVIQEMEYLIKERGFKSVYFDDDTFNIGKERMLQFCNEVIKRGLQGVPWAIMARADLMDAEILSAMKSAGLWAVKYGVESVDELMIEDCHKDLDLEINTQMIKLTKALGIKVHLTFTFGIGGETKESIRDTIDYALSLNPDSVQFSILTPFPGTKLFAELDKEGRIITKDWSRYDGHYYCVFKPENLEPQDLIEAKIRAYRIWGECIRKKRGMRGDIARFKDYLQKHGLRHALGKTLDYLRYAWFKKQRYLKAK